MTKMVDRTLAVQIGARIRAERQRKRWTQAALARAMDAPRYWVTRVELGYYALRADQLLKIAQALKIKPARLLPPLTEVSHGEAVP